MIGFTPSGVLKLCVYCMPFSSQSALCVCILMCVYGRDHVCVWFVVIYIPFFFFPFFRALFSFPLGRNSIQRVNCIGKLGV